MKTLNGHVAGYDILILVEDENRTCSMRVYLPPPIDLVVREGDYPNARMLSADLACQIGYGPACDFLHAHEVPQSSLLWHLNHSGYAPPYPSAIADVKLYD